jgi:SAM-dependent methyltransferase
VNPDYGQRYRDLFKRHWWWRARSEFIVETLRRLQPRRGWNSILDVGCGDGLFFPRLSEFGDVEGVEPSSALIRPDNPDRQRIHICPLDDNFRPGKRYSLILMLDVLEHLADPAAALRDMLRLLEPSGTFVATVPAFMSLWTNHDVTNHHYTRYTKRSFAEVARHAGLRIREERYLYHWTCPLKLAQRASERLLRQAPALPTIPPRWLNEMFFRLSRLEQKTVSRLLVPFGSSLLIVAEAANAARAERQPAA